MVQFYINQFDASTNAAAATVYSKPTPADLSDNDVSANITMAVQVKVDAMSKMFFYFTDHFITDKSDTVNTTNPAFVDSSYVRHFINSTPLKINDLTVQSIEDHVNTDPNMYYIDQTNFYVDNSLNDASSVHFLFNPRLGVVTSNTFRNNTASFTTPDPVTYTGDILSKDFLRSIANDLFNTHLGADLFNNEAAFTTDFDNKCDETADKIRNALEDLDCLTGTNDKLDTSILPFESTWGTENLADMSLNVSTGNTSFYGFKDEDIPENITRRMLLTLLNTEPNRFADISKNSFFDANGEPITLNYGRFFKMPFEAGDTLCYKFTVAPHESQNDIFNATTNAAVPRSYKVVITLVD